MWQDTVIAICQLIFFPAMMPTVLGKDKPALSTSVLNALLVSIIAFCFFTLNLWFSVVTASLTAFLWVVLAVQKYQQIKKHKTV